MKSQPHKRARSNPFQNHLWNGETITAIHAELTDRCNSGCPMCPRYINNGMALNPHLANAEVTLEQFKSWFSAEFILGLRKFLACGNYGDPCNARDMLEIFQYMREINPHVGLSLHSNASVRTPAWWSALGRLVSRQDLGDYCTFSIDGLADTNHLYRRGTQFKKIIENAQAFIDAGGLAHWDYIVFDYNEHQVDEAREMAIQMGFRNFNVKRTTRWHLYKEDRGEFDVRNRAGELLYTLRQPLNPRYKDETFEVLKQNLQRPNYVTEQDFDQLYSDDIYQNVSDRNGSFIKVKHNEIEVACRAARSETNVMNEMFLSATGHIFPCCYLGGEPWRYDGQSDRSKDSFLEMIALNGGMESIDLKRHSLDDILSSPLYANMLKRSMAMHHSMRSRQCSTCCGKTWNKLDHGEVGNKQGSYLEMDPA